jgi:cell division protein FtsB
LSTAVFSLSRAGPGFVLIFFAARAVIRNEDMRRLLPIFVAGFAIASILIYFFGDSGLIAYRRLNGYRQALAANIQDLQARNGKLTQDLASLRDDPQRSLVLARKIGLYQAGDEVVKLGGVSWPMTSNEVGALLKLKKSRSSRNAIFKATGIAVSLALAALAFVAGRSSRRKRAGGA